MRTSRLAIPALAVALLAAVPAVAATPGNGTYTGSARYKACGGTKADNGCAATMKLTVSKGKVTKLAYTIPEVKTSATFKPKKPITVSANGTFSYMDKKGDESRVLKGRFSSSTKGTATYEAKSEDSNLSFPRATFSLKKK